MPLHRITSDHHFFLFDRLGVDEPPTGIPAVPVVPRGLENEAHLMPVLIDLRTLDMAQHALLINWLADELRCSGHLPAGVWLQTEAGEARLLSHLADRLVVRLANGERCLLRYYDPKVVAHLRWIFEPARLDHLLGPVGQWSYWLDGKWCRMSPSSSAPGRVAGIDAHRGQQLRRIAALNTLLAGMPSSPDRAHFEQTARLLSGHIERAQSYGWRDERDWVSFGRLCVGCHPHFDSHPRIRHMIERLPDDEACFADAVALVDAAVLRDIARELDAATEQRECPR